MLDKILKGLLPVTIIISVVQTISPFGVLSFLDQYSMIVTSLMVYSLGWVVTSFVFRKNDSNYSLGRHIGLAAVMSVPIVAIIFVPSFLYPYIVGKAFTFRFLAIISLCSSLYLFFTDENFKLKGTPFVIGYSAFVIAMALATIFSMDPSRSFWSNYERMEGYINLISLFILAISAASLKISELEWKRIFTVHIWISSIVSSLGVLQYVTGILGLKVFGQLPILSLCLSSGANCRVDSTLGNSIYLGIYAALTFWLIIFAIFGKRVRGNLLPVLAGINLLAVYFSGTRGVWLGLLLGLGVLLVTKYWFDGNKKAVAVTIIGGLLFLSVFAGVIFYAKQNNLWQNVPIVARFSSVNTLFARWNIWQTAITSWSQKPIFGWGQENFIHAFNLNYNPAMYGQETYFDHPHNTYLGWLVFGGIIGFLAFLFMLGSAIYGIIKANLVKEKENDLIIPILLALVTTYVVHIFFVFDNLTSSLLFVLMAVYFGKDYEIWELKIPTIKHKQLVGGVAVLIGVVFVYKAIYMPSYANLTVINAMTYQQRSGVQNPVEVLSGTKALYEKAINMNTFGNYEIREFYLQKSLEFINLIPQVTDESVKNGIVSVAQSALDQFLTQVKNNPFDHRARFMLGLYYLNIKQYDSAIQTLNEAVKLAPSKQIALIYLAKAYLLKGDVANASVYYERAIAVTPKTIGGYDQLRMEYIQILAVSGQEQKIPKYVSELTPVTTRGDYSSLVQQINQAFGQIKDMKAMIGYLAQASNADPNNISLVIWLAQAYQYDKDSNNATMTINRLANVAPEVVAQFNQNLNESIEQAKLQKAAK